MLDSQFDRVLMAQQNTDVFFLAPRLGEALKGSLPLEGGVRDPLVMFLKPKIRMLGQGLVTLDILAEEVVVFGLSEESLDDRVGIRDLELGDLFFEMSLCPEPIHCVGFVFPSPVDDQ